MNFFQQAIVGGLGDILIQALEWKRSGGKSKFELRRLLVFSTVTALYIAPVIHVWFGWLNSLPYPTSWNENTKALGMMFLDQTIGATVITMGFFFAFEIVSCLTKTLGITKLLYTILTYNETPYSIF
jgi:hypothetical protein